MWITRAKLEAILSEHSGLLEAKQEEIKYLEGVNEILTNRVKALEDTNDSLRQNNRSLKDQLGYVREVRLGATRYGLP